MGAGTRIPVRLHRTSLDSGFATSAMRLLARPGTVCEGGHDAAVEEHGTARAGCSSVQIEGNMVAAQFDGKERVEGGLGMQRTLHEDSPTYNAAADGG